MKNNNQINVPEAKAAMENFKMQAAQEVGVNLKKGYTQINDIANAQDIEQDINEYRNNLKEEHLLNLENKTYNYLTGVYYMDLVNECEHVGDFMINISEAIMEIK